MTNAGRGWTPASSQGTNVLKIKDSPKRVSMSRPDRDWHREVVDKLNELTALPRGWDGYHGRAVRFDTANFALQMLEHICPEDSPAPQIIPGVQGDLQIEWHTDNGDIELDIRGPYKVEAWFASYETGPDGEEQLLKSDFTIASEWVRKVTEPVVAEPAAA